jgi:hypothetical protein
MGEFGIGDRVRLAGDEGRLGTVAQYTEERLAGRRDRYLIVSWDDTETPSQQIHESKFERAARR